MMRFRPSHFPRIVNERILAGSLIDEWLQGTWLNSCPLGQVVTAYDCLDEPLSPPNHSLNAPYLEDLTDYSVPVRSPV